MATPESSGELPEQPDGDPISASSPPSGPASRRGFNWRNRWVLIGGGSAAIVAVVVIVVAVMLTGGGPGGSSSALALVPDDTEALSCSTWQPSGAGRPTSPAITTTS